MCGIAGYFGERPEADGAAVLASMAAALKHRGPDDAGVWQGEDRRAGLAHARLAIIDLSPGGHQPMEGGAGTFHISFNGEIYNFKELRRELRAAGHSFRTESDTEVILAAYRAWGIAAFARLSGMFALAIFDGEKNELVLARDLAGKKPLYWTLQKRALVFGSELKALRAYPGLSFDMDPRSLAQYLGREYVPTPRTIYKDIFKLPPGMALRYVGGDISLVRWGELCAEAVEVSEKEALERLDALLSEATARRLIADVPLGVFLSGGIDSSTVAYYAAQKSGARVKTFSIGFSEKSFDESAYARMVAAALGTEHHERVLSPDDALALVGDIPQVFDEPVADASVLPTMLLSQFTRQKVAVALGGDGADEFLLGYPTFAAEGYARYFGRLSRAARAGLGRAADLLPAGAGYMSIGFKARKFTHGFDDDPAARHLQWLGSFADAELRSIFSPDYAAYGTETARDLGREWRAECPNLSGLSVLSHLYARTYLLDQVLVKVDRASMRYGLEVRAPFLDPKVMRFLLSLPPELKLRRGRGKHLLRSLMRGRLPDAVLDRPKRGFAVPLAAWLRAPLKPLMLDLLSTERLQKQGFFEIAEVERLIEEHLSGTRDNRKKLWTLLVFQLWYENWM